MARQPDPSLAPRRSTAKRGPAGEPGRVVGLCARVLGPLELEVVLDDGRRIPVQVDWRSATEGALRSFIASPNGVQGTRVAQRAGYKSAHDIVSKLREVLKPVGLAISRYPGSSGYRLVSLSSGEAVDVESDLDEFRGRAVEFLGDDAKRLRSILASDGEVDVSSLRVIEERLADLLGLWRAQDPEDRVRVLQNVPDAKRPSDDLKLDGELRACSIECELALARAQNAGSRLQSAREAITHLDKFGSPAASVGGSSSAR